MASFQAETGRDRSKKRKKFLCSEPFLPDLSLRIPKKIVKKYKNLENNILASFQVEMRRDRMPKRAMKFLKK